MLQGNASTFLKTFFLMTDNAKHNFRKHYKLIDKIKLNKILECCLINEMFKKIKSILIQFREEEVQLSGGESKNKFSALYNLNSF